MEFSIATLLSNFADDKLVAPKALEKKLECQDETSIAKLQIALDALEKIGILVKEKGRYRRVPETGVVEAKLRCSSKGFCFAIQDTEGAEDIYIRECHLSNAWNGDRVLVRIIKEGSRRRSPEGEVRLILERGNPSVLARVKQTDMGYRAVPLDDRLLFELELKANGTNLAEAVDHLVHVEVLRYSLGQYLPLGKIAKILGIDAEAANDLDIVCCKHDLTREFNSNVLLAAEDFPKSIRKIDMKDRVSLRQLLTLSFVNSSSKKSEKKPIVEHAFTLEALKKSHFRLGVHVSDVAHYVKADDALDREAQKLGNAVHLGETTLNLFPEYFSQEVCSLLPGQERLAWSVLMTLDASGQLVEFEIQPTVIEVDEQITYQQADKILAGTEENPAVSAILTQLQALSLKLKEQRQQRGGFTLNLVDNENPYDDEASLGVMASILSVNKVQNVISELIVLTNQVIATHLRELGVPALYRVQAPPDPDDLQEFVKLAGTLGIDLQLLDEEAVEPEDIKEFVDRFSGLESERVLTYQLQSILKSAVYSTSPRPHFGLALESGYTHFCSPIQRYTDLLIQRILQSVFEVGRDRRTTRAKERVNLNDSTCHGKINWNVLPPEIHHELESRLSLLVVNLTDREKVAWDAQSDLIGLKKAGLMKECTGETFTGLITGVQSYGFFVEIELPNRGDEFTSIEDGVIRVEGLVHVSSLKDDWYEYRSRQMTLVGRKNRASYRLGDRVEVQVKSVDYYRQQIDLAVVGGGFQESSDYDESSNSDMDFDSDSYYAD